MIPELKVIVHTQEKIPVGEAVSCLKLHNGMAYRNPKVSFVVFREREPVLFLKSVRHTRDNSVIEHAHEALKRAYTDQHRLQYGLHIPTPRWCVSLGGYAVSAEGIVHGRPLDIQNKHEVNQGLGVLRAWHTAAARASTQHSDLSSVYRRFCSDMGFQERLQMKLDAQFEQFLERAGDAVSRMSSIAAHGDATPSNILLQSNGELAAVDWDRYGDIDIPLFDILTFIERVVQKHENPFTHYRVEIQQYLNLLQCSDEVFPLLAFLYVIATEWRKRLRVHLYERFVIDEDFEKTFLLTMKWIEEWK